MSLDCPLIKPLCKKKLIMDNKPYEKPKCPLSDLVPKCPLTPPPCPLAPPKCPLTPPTCPLTPAPCPLAPPKCPLTPAPCPLAPPKCPLTPEPCPLAPPKCPPTPSPCPLAPPKCPLTPTPCPLAPPKCPLTPEPCPLAPPKCPLTPAPCPLAPPPCPLAPPKCPLIPSPCPLAPPKCPLIPSPCPLAPPKCPLTPAPCPLAPPKCPLTPAPCPLAPPKCPLTPSPCPLAPPKCPLIPAPCPLAPPKCPLTPAPCPLSPPKCPLTPPKCPLTPPKCPLTPPPCPLTSPSNDDYCPLDDPISKGPCAHTQFLNRSLSRKPLSYPLPPTVCHEVARKCPFEPRPMICHDTCPCLEIPDLDCGPRCPFLPQEPICPPVCPLEKQPNCPLIQKPQCMWKPAPNASNCPLTPSNSTLNQPPGQCPLNDSNICPSVLNVPRKKVEEPPKYKTSNVHCCPFCCDEPDPPIEVPKSSRTFHVPSCPMAKPPCPVHPLPSDKPVCPFYPCPCPLTGISECCPIKVPPLNAFTGTDSPSQGSGCSLSCSVSRTSQNSCTPGCPSPPGNQFGCTAPASDCPLAQFKCPQPKPPPLPPCPVKGCLKKKSVGCPGDCPVKTDSCSLFPQGRCPMDNDLGLCDCDYPVPPCLAYPSPEDPPAPSQYCVQDNCCMGLPDPPVTPSPFKSDLYYSYQPLYPEKETSKYYVEVSLEPPEDLEPFTPPKRPLRPQCSIIKFGEGYQQCKSVQSILEKRGSCSDTGSQYDLADCPMSAYELQIQASKKKLKKKK